MRAVSLLLLLAAACQPSRTARETSQLPEDRDDLEACLQREAVTDLGAERKQRCVARLESFLEAQPADPRSEWASFQLGRFYMERMDFSSAYHLFSTFAERFPSSSRHALARTHLGICLYYLERYRESLDLLHPLVADPEAEAQAVEVSRYLAEDYVALRNLPSALGWYERCLNLIPAESEKTRLQKRVLEVMSQGWAPEELQHAAGVFPEGFFAEAVHFGFAATCYLRSQPRLALNHLQKMAERHPEDVFTPYVSTLIKRISAERLPEVCTIGCLLPLTGKYGKFGNQILEALLLGSGAFPSYGETGSSIRLLIRDTRGDPGTAVAMLRELARDPEVVGIVGPLLTSEAQACAPEAQQAGIPLITLSQREDVARGADYVFLNGLSMRQQVETLVGYAEKGLGCTRFAVLYPEDNYGRLARDLFVKRVQETGGRVVSSVSYGDQEADFQEEIRRLAGTAAGWPEGHAPEPASAFRTAAGPGTGTAGDAPPAGEVPEPPGEGSGFPSGLGTEWGARRALLPFDALFLPDNYRKVALIAPTLAFQDLRGIVLLGTSAWNSPHLAESAGEYLREAVFVDGFFSESSMPPVPDFVVEFRNEFQREPGVLEALSYDSLMILAEGFGRAQPKTRSGLRDAMAHLEGYPGLSGFTRFDEEGCAQKTLYLLAIKDKRIQQIH